jgi:GxxExxY protein
MAMTRIGFWQTGSAAGPRARPAGLGRATARRGNLLPQRGAKSARGKPAEEGALALCDAVREEAFVIYRYHRHAHLEGVYANNDLCVFCAFSRQAHWLCISGAIDLQVSIRQHKGDVCHLTAQVEKTSLPRKSAQDAKREESTMEDIMKLCDVVRETGFAIHRYHKHGHLEKVYENALAHRLRKLGLDMKQQHPLKVYDEDGTLIGDYNADLFVDNRLIIELKAAKALADEHVAQILGYLRASRVEHGLLINFGAPKFEIKKYALSQSGQGVGTGGLASALLSIFAFLAPFRG